MPRLLAGFGWLREHGNSLRLSWCFERPPLKRLWRLMLWGLALRLHPGLTLRWMP